MKTAAVMANSAWNIFNYRKPLLKKLKLTGWRIIVIAASDGFEKKVDDALYDEWIEIKKLRAKGKNPLNDIKLWLELSGIMNRVRPDILLSFTIKPNIFGVMAAANKSVTCIPTVTGLGSSFIRKDWVSRLTERLYARAFKLAERVIFHNTDDHTHFLRKGLISKSQGHVVNGSGINTRALRALSLERHKPFTFLFLGRLLVDKGAEMFINAAIRIKMQNEDLRFILAGDAPEVESGGISKDTLLKAQKLGIECVGFVDDTRELLEHVDCLVLPSLREGMPRAVLEALSMSRLVIVSDVPGCRQSIEDGQSGFMFDLNQKDDLAMTMLKVARMSDKEQLKIRENARLRAEQLFDEDIITGKYIEIIEEAIG